MSYSTVHIFKPLLEMNKTIRYESCDIFLFDSVSFLCCMESVAVDACFAISPGACTDEVHPYKSVT